MFAPLIYTDIARAPITLLDEAPKILFFVGRMACRRRPGWSSRQLPWWGDCGQWRLCPPQIVAQCRAKMMAGLDTCKEQEKIVSP